jgi:hypothetical protein
LRPVLLATLLFLLSLLLPYSPGAEERRARFLFDPSAIQLADIPPWMTGGVVESIQQTLNSLSPRNLLEAEQIERLAEELKSGSSWVAGVVEIRRRFPNEVELELAMRVPAALVQGEGRLYFVDADARVLGALSDAPALQDELQLPMIEPVRDRATVFSGAEIEDPVVRDGLKIVRSLAGHVDELRARNIHISVVDLSPVVKADPLRLTDVELVTHRGIRIEWGRVISSELSRLDPPVDVRVRHILRIASRYPRLDGLTRLRVQFDRDEDVTVLEEVPVADEGVFEDWPGG